MGDNQLINQAGSDYNAILNDIGAIAIKRIQTFSVGSIFAERSSKTNTDSEILCSIQHVSTDNEMVNAGMVEFGEAEGYFKPSDNIRHDDGLGTSGGSIWFVQWPSGGQWWRPYQVDNLVISGNSIYTYALLRKENSDTI